MPLSEIRRGRDAIAELMVATAVVGLGFAVPLVLNPYATLVVIVVFRGRFRLGLIESLVVVSIPCTVLNLILPA